MRSVHELIHTLPALAWLFLLGSLAMEPKAREVSMCLGIDAYEKELPRTLEGEILRIAYDNIVVSTEGSYELVRKLLPPTCLVENVSSGIAGVAR